MKTSKRKKIGNHLPLHFRTILFLCLGMLISVKSNSQNKDSIKVCLQGIQSLEAYKVFYNGKLISKIKCKSEMCHFYFSVAMDSTIIEGKLLNLKIYRKGKLSMKFKNTNLITKYEAKKPYLIIYRDIRLKNKYALSYFWGDEPMIYIHGSSSVKIKD